MGNHATEPALDLTEQWQFLAAHQRDLGAKAQADTLEWCARQLEGARRAWETETLPLAAAAEESGYTVEHLGRLVREGQIPNAGLSGSPRIRRVDLPRKPGRASTDGHHRISEVSSAEQIARSVAASEGGCDG